MKLFAIGTLCLVSAAAHAIPVQMHFADEEAGNSISFVIETSVFTSARYDIWFPKGIPPGEGPCVSSMSITGMPISNLTATINGQAVDGLGTMLAGFVADIPAGGCHSNMFSFMGATDGVNLFSWNVDIPGISFAEFTANTDAMGQILMNQVDRNYGFASLTGPWGSILDLHGGAVSVPEPATGALFFLGWVGALLVRRRSLSRIRDG